MLALETIQLVIRYDQPNSSVVANPDQEAIEDLEHRMAALYIDPENREKVIMNRKLVRQQ